MYDEQEKSPVVEKCRHRNEASLPKVRPTKEEKKY